MFEKDGWVPTPLNIRSSNAREIPFLEDLSIQNKDPVFGGSKYF